MEGSAGSGGNGEAKDGAAQTERRGEAAEEVDIAKQRQEVSCGCSSEECVLASQHLAFRGPAFVLRVVCWSTMAVACGCRSGKRRGRST